MPTMSYVAFATKGQKDKLVCSARKIKGVRFILPRTIRIWLLLSANVMMSPPIKLILKH